MQRQAQDIRGGFAAAPGVTITRLPFGGAVLLNASTLALLECAEPDAELVTALIGAPANRNGSSDQMAAALERAAAALVRDGWLVPANEGGAR